MRGVVIHGVSMPVGEVGFWGVSISYGGKQSNLSI